MNPERFEQVYELYHAALEREAGERGELLAQADPELRREVESLLEQSGGLPERPAWEGAALLLADSTSTQLLFGTQLGPYRIEAPLGAGGMGQVYKAQDTRLGRSVAIKISLKQFSGRFEREARAISALNHPHICTLYDIGPNYLVMEFVEGPTLAALLKKGPLPLELVLRYGAEIADALAEAHSHGIIHRDLKPGNVMLSKAGVKVLDFGLAKFTELAAAAKRGEIETATHAVMGTPAYMAPEQALGRELDERADLFSFGVLLYEMATGTRPFRGDTPSATMDAILHQVPMQPSQLNPSMPVALGQIIERALEKDLEVRYQTASGIRADLKRLIRDIGSGGVVSAPIAPVAPRRRGWWIVEGAQPAWPWITVALALGLFVGCVLLYQATRPAPLRPLMRLNVVLEENMPLVSISDGRMIALSRDGVRLALTLRGADGKGRLYTRLLNQSQVTPLPGTENADFPFFSPDGEWIGFFADGKLKKMAVEGGAAVTLCDAPVNRGASWGDDGNIIAALNATGVLSRVPSTGGTPVPVTKLNHGEITHRWPQVLPGSQAALLTVSTHQGNYDDANIDVVSLKTGERKTVEHDGFSPHYLATSTRTGSNGTGHLIYLHQNTLFAVAFNPDRLALTGAPAPVLEDVSSSSGGGGLFAFAGAPSGPGTFVYLAGKGQGDWSISWLESSGKTKPLHAPRGFYFTPRFSPDGKRLAFSSASGQGDNIWVKDLNRDTPSRLSFLLGLNRSPVWTPDGKNIVFQSTNSDAPGMYWIRLDGSGEAQRLTDGKLQEIPYSFSPDGKRLAFQQVGNGGSFDIFTAPIEGDPERGTHAVRLGKAELFLGTPFAEVNPAFSPDGRWLAYISNESGTSEVYVRSFAGPGGRRQISTSGGTYPLWSRDRRELFFQTLDLRVMAVSYTAEGDSFVAGKPWVWSETRLRNTGLLCNYDLAPDGKRFAAILVNDEASGQKPRTHLTFLLNLFDELQRRAPTGK